MRGSKVYCGDVRARKYMHMEKEVNVPFVVELRSGPIGLDPITYTHVEGHGCQ